MIEMLSKHPYSILYQRVVFELDNEAKIMNQWFGKTIIHSNHRFTYETAQTIIEQNDGLFYKELITINQLAKILREKRKKNGAISFNKTEISFTDLPVCLE